MEFRDLYYTENKMFNQSLDIFLPDQTTKKIPIFIYLYVMFFYVLNLIMVGTDIVLYIINYRRERKQHE